MLRGKPTTWLPAADRILSCSYSYVGWIYSLEKTLKTELTQPGTSIQPYHELITQGNINQFHINQLARTISGQL